MALFSTFFVLKPSHNMFLSDPFIYLLYLFGLFVYTATG